MTSHKNDNADHASNEEPKGGNSKFVAPKAEGGADLGGTPSVPRWIQQFANVIGTMTAQMQAQAQAQVPTFDKNLKRIRKLGVENFTGSLDPQEAHYWLMKVEDVLELIPCAPETWVRYVECLLTSDAWTWWNSLKRTRGDQVITWTDFKKEFDDKYFPQSYRDKKKIEFLTLKQNEMAVHEYEHRFAALSTYAPFVATEEDKCIIFEQGLNPEIKMGIPRIRDFKLLVETAMRIENVLNQRSQSWAAKRARSDSPEEQNRLTKRRGSQSFSSEEDDFYQNDNYYEEGRLGGSGYVEYGTVSGGQSTGNNMQYGSGSGNTFRGSARSDFVPACSTCGRHHRGVCWRLKKITCYGCGEVGHYRNVCPYGTETAPSQTIGWGNAMDDTIGADSVQDEQEALIAPDVISALVDDIIEGCAGDLKRSHVMDVVRWATTEMRVHMVQEQLHLRL
ncbi:uncharacterized protein [Euphorbia lathyris]|uniref:uncharacterized protein isoform X2 n=1 Tax=Euphorbia lathyris TaxID=212925 RepID=UPI003313A3F0